MTSKIVLNFKKLNFITISAMISFPVLNTGYLIGLKCNLISACISIVLANTLATFLCLKMLKLSLTTSKSPLEFINLFFADFPTKLFSIIFFISACFWFSHQLHDMVEILTPTFPVQNRILLILFIGMSMSLFLREGVLKILRIAYYAIPIGVLFLAFLGYEAIVNLNNSLFENPFSLSTYFSLEGIIGAFCTVMLAIIELPSYYRFSTNLKISQKSLTFCLVGSLSVIEIIGVLVSLSSGGTSLYDSIGILTKSDKQIVVLIFVMLSGCCANNVNLYAGALSLKNLFPTADQPNLILFTGLFATIITCLWSINEFDLPMMIKSTIIATVISILICKMKLLEKNHYHFNSRTKNLHYAISIVSIIWGLLAYYYECEVTTSPITDAFLLTAILCGIQMMFNNIYRRLVKQPIRTHVRATAAKQVNHSL